MCLATFRLTCVWSFVVLRLGGHLLSRRALPLSVTSHPDNMLRPLASEPVECQERVVHFVCCVQARETFGVQLEHSSSRKLMTRLII